jgi:phage baseplate assembly protein W
LIELPRYLVRNFRAVLRKSVLLYEPRTTVTAITLQTGADGFTIRARQADIAVEHRLNGSFA